MAHVPASVRRPQLIQAAIDLMVREGLAAGNTRAIAAELGVAQATVHYTFGTKEELYIGVLRHLTGDLVAQVERAAPCGGDFAEAIAALAAGLWRTVQERPANYKLLYELCTLALHTPRLSEVLESHYRDMFRMTGDLVARTAARTGQDLAQPPETVARFFLAGFDGLTLQRFALRDEEAETVCLQTLVSSVVAFAVGRTKPVLLPAKDSQPAHTSSL
ncbi:TetR/AcrR family transcriptional regulator [Amycolatopsis jejuensis]|uniref:TetR/AcrR family transcriptional regulator n=1 Tax=Amycolatopsis jejuensis TaxID=330084 RepID=UPI00068D8CD9|nr:TetR/AcrR family transcriptional regulator [Amycolatopsis jejuensis]